MKRIHFGLPAIALGAFLASSALAQDHAYLSSDLFGAYVLDGGVEDATGDFNGEADLAKAELCYFLEVYDLADADAASIHEGTKTKSGPVVVTLTLPQDQGKEVCVPVDKTLLQAMTQKPEEYYIAVRSPAHPNGAIRGQPKE